MMLALIMDHIVLFGLGMRLVMLQVVGLGWATEVILT